MPHKVAHYHAMGQTDPSEDVRTLIKDFAGKHKNILASKEHEYFVNNDYRMANLYICLLYTSPSPRDRTRSRMPSSA